MAAFLITNTAKISKRVSDGVLNRSIFPSSYLVVSHSTLLLKAKTRPAVFPLANISSSLRAVLYLWFAKAGSGQLGARRL